MAAARDGRAVSADDHASVAGAVHKLGPMAIIARGVRRILLAMHSGGREGERR